MTIFSIAASNAASLQTDLSACQEIFQRFHKIA